MASGRPLLQRLISEIADGGSELLVEGILRKASFRPRHRKGRVMSAPPSGGFEEDCLWLPESPLPGLRMRGTVTMMAALAESVGGLGHKRKTHLGRRGLKRSADSRHLGYDNNNVRVQPRRMASGQKGGGVVGTES